MACAHKTRIWIYQCWTLDFDSRMTDLYAKKTISLNKVQSISAGQFTGFHPAEGEHTYGRFEMALNNAKSTESWKFEIIIPPVRVLECL